MSTECSQVLGPGLAMLSAAIETGEVQASEFFTTFCEECPSALTDAAKEKAIDKIDDKAMCQVMCCCKGQTYRQVCVQQTLDKADELLDGHSRYKAEVSYNMTSTVEEKIVPTPFMHRENGQPTTQRSHRWQTRAQEEIEDYTPGMGMVRRPDVVIVKDPLKPPYQDNIHRIVEMKFSGETENDGQFAAYRTIAGSQDKLDIMEEDQCRCDQDNDGQRAPYPIPVFKPESEKEKKTVDQPKWWELPVYATATLVLATATAILTAVPFDGPVGEMAAGASTAAAATRFAQAWRTAFAVAR